MTAAGYDGHMNDSHEVTHGSQTHDGQKLVYNESIDRHVCVVAIIDIYSGCHCLRPLLIWPSWTEMWPSWFVAVIVVPRTSEAVYGEM